MAGFYIVVEMPDAAHLGQMAEKGLDLGRPHVARVTLAMKQDEAPSPLDVRALRSQRIVLDSDALAELIQ